MRLLALVDGDEVLVVGEGGVQHALEHLARNLTGFSQVGSEDQPIFRDWGLRGLHLGGTQAHGDLAGQQGSDAARRLRTFCRRFELVGEGARGREGHRVLIADAVLGDQAGAAGFR